MKVPRLLLAAAVAAAPAAHAQTVRAVLFHSPTCPHCRQVITEDLPIFFEVYGGRPQGSRGDPHVRLLSNGTLTVLFVDASEPAGGALYDASYGPYPVSPERRGVPRLIVGDSVLVGSVEIPTRLHTIIRNGLAGDGIPWPAIPGLREVIARFERAGDQRSDAPPAAPALDTARQADTTPPRPDRKAATPADAALAPGAAGAPGGTIDSTAPADTTGVPTDPFETIGVERMTTVGQHFRRDPAGNSLAILGLAAMVLMLAAVSAGVPVRVGPRNPGVWLPVLAVAGAGVAAYLAYIEVTGTTAICGPVGDCNAVQQSEYARLFGVLPVGVVGLAGYGVVLVLWVLGQEGRPAAALIRRILVAGALIGTLFSVYLTALEPFVIGATCLWCLLSAGIMTGVLWLASAWSGLHGPDLPDKSL